jgi:hypothetical protein
MHSIHFHAERRLRALSPRIRLQWHLDLDLPHFFECGHLAHIKNHIFAKGIFPARRVLSYREWCNACGKRVEFDQAAIVCFVTFVVSPEQLLF